MVIYATDLEILELKKLYLGVIGIAAVLLFSLTNEKIVAHATLYLTMSDYAPSPDSIVIIPVLTANAYKYGAFYHYFEGNCDESCLTTDIDPDISLGEGGSMAAARTLQKVGYDSMSDYALHLELTNNPHYLDRYQKVIVLHSEYVTIEIFDALQRHTKVIYLAPNAMYGMIQIHGDSMTLVQGHSYRGYDNAFDWEYENTRPYEFEKTCKDWKLNPIGNGYQLNCNPEHTIHKNFELLKAISKI